MTTELTEWETILDTWQDHKLQTLFETTLPQVAQWLARHASDALIPTLRTLIWAKIENDLNLSAPIDIPQYFKSVLDAYGTGTLANPSILFHFFKFAEELLDSANQALVRALKSRFHEIIDRDFQRLLVHTEPGADLWDAYVFGNNAIWYRWFLFDSAWLRSVATEPMAPFEHRHFQNRLNVPEIEKILTTLSSAPGKDHAIRRTRFLAWLAEYNDVWRFNPNREWIAHDIHPTTREYTPGDVLPFAAMAESYKSSLAYVGTGNPNTMVYDGGFIDDTVLNAWYGCLQVRYADEMRRNGVYVILDAGDVFGQLSRAATDLSYFDDPAQLPFVAHETVLKMKAAAGLGDDCRMFYFVSPIASKNSHFSLFVIVAYFSDQRTITCKAFHYDSLQNSQTNPKIANEIWKNLLANGLASAFSTRSVTMDCDADVVQCRPPKGSSQKDATCGTYVAYMTQKILDQVKAENDVRGTRPLDEERLYSFQNTALKVNVSVSDIVNKQLMIHDALKAAHLFEKAMLGCFPALDAVTSENMTMTRMANLSAEADADLNRRWKDFLEKTTAFRIQAWERLYLIPELADPVLAAFFQSCKQWVAPKVPFTLISLNNTELLALYGAYREDWIIGDTSKVDTILERTIRSKVFNVNTFRPDVWADIIHVFLNTVTSLDARDIKNQLTDWYESPALFKEAKLRDAFVANVLATPQLFDAWYVSLIEPIYGTDLEMLCEDLGVTTKLNWDRVSDVHANALNQFAVEFSAAVLALPNEKDSIRRCNEFFHRNWAAFLRHVNDPRFPGVQQTFQIDNTDKTLLDELSLVFSPGIHDEWAKLLEDFQKLQSENLKALLKFFAPLSPRTLGISHTVHLLGVLRPGGTEWKEESFAAFQVAISHNLETVLACTNSFKALLEERALLGDLHDIQYRGNVAVIHSLATFAMDAYGKTLGADDNTLLQNVMLVLVHGSRIQELSAITNLRQWSVWRDVHAFDSYWTRTFYILGFLKGQNPRLVRPIVKYSASVPDESLLAIRDMINFLAVDNAALTRELNTFGNLSMKWYQLIRRRVPIVPLGTEGALRDLKTKAETLQSTRGLLFNGFIGKDRPDVIAYSNQLVEIRHRYDQRVAAAAAGIASGTASTVPDELKTLLYDIEVFITMAHIPWPHGQVLFTTDGSKQVDRIYGSLKPVKQQKDTLDAISALLTTMEAVLTRFTLKNEDEFFTTYGISAAWKAFRALVGNPNDRFAFLVDDAELDSKSTVEQLSHYQTILGVYKHVYMDERSTKEEFNRFHQQCITDASVTLSLLHGGPYYFETETAAQNAKTLLEAWDRNVSTVLERVFTLKSFLRNSKQLPARIPLTPSNVNAEYDKGRFNALKSTILELQRTKIDDRAQAFNARDSVKALLDYIHMGAHNLATFDIRGAHYFAATPQIQAEMLAAGIPVLLDNIKDFKTRSDENRLFVERELFNYLKAPLQTLMSLDDLARSHTKFESVRDMDRSFDSVADIFNALDTLHTALRTYFNPIYDNLARVVDVLVASDDTFFQRLGLGVQPIRFVDFDQAALALEVDHTDAANAHDVLQRMTALRDFRRRFIAAVAIQANADTMLLDPVFLGNHLRPFIANILDDVLWSNAYFQQKAALLRRLIPLPAPPPRPVVIPLPPPPPLPDMYEDGEPSALRILNTHYLPVRTGPLKRRHYLNSDILPVDNSAMVIEDPPPRRPGDRDPDAPIPWEEDRLDVHRRRMFWHVNKQHNTHAFVPAGPPDRRSEDFIHGRLIERYYLGHADPESQRQLDISARERDELDAFRTARREFVRAQNANTGLRMNI